MRKQAIRHVFFDLDRTLWDFEANSKATLDELIDEFGIPQKASATADEFLQVYVAINEQYWERYRVGDVSREQLRSGRFADTLTHFGVPDSELADVLADAYVERSPRRTALVEGTQQILHELSGKYALHIITNGFEEVQHIKLSASEIGHHFGEVITSERAGVKKPDVGIFRFAERLTGAVPENSIMIGDHLEADVQGALGAGWQAVHFAPEGSVPGRHWHITSLHQLSEML